MGSTLAFRLADNKPVPCRTCGAKTEVNGSDGRYRVYHVEGLDYNCWIGPLAKSEGEAVRGWNNIMEPHEVS